MQILISEDDTVKILETENDSSTNNNILNVTVKLIQNSQQNVFTILHFILLTNKII